MSTAIVEEYVPKDANDVELLALRRLFVDTFYENYQRIESLLNLDTGKALLPWLEEGFDDMQNKMLTKEFRTFIIRYESVIAGLMTVKEMSEKLVYISQLAIHTSFKRRGYGDMLMNHLVNIYGSNMTCEILCRRVNKPALDFYLKKGAKIVDDEQLANKYGCNSTDYVSLQITTEQ